MTISTPLNAQAFGTGANVGNGKFPTKVTLEAATTAIQIEARIVNGQAYYDERQDVLVHFALSTVDLTAAAAVETTKQSSRFLQIAHGREPLADRVRMTDLEAAPGGAYLYMWVDAPNLEVASTISLNVIQYP